MLTKLKITIVVCVFLANPCFLDFDRGRCNYLNEDRWYFDRTSGKCQNFTYGGCFGNENHFASQTQCMDRCENTVLYIIIIHNIFCTCRSVFRLQLAHCFKEGCTKDFWSRFGILFIVSETCVTQENVFSISHTSQLSQGRVKFPRSIQC